MGVVPRARGRLAVAALEGSLQALERQVRRSGAHTILFGVDPDSESCPGDDQRHQKASSPDQPGATGGRGPVPAVLDNVRHANLTCYPRRAQELRVVLPPRGLHPQGVRTDGTDVQADGTVAAWTGDRRREGFPPGQSDRGAVRAARRWGSEGRERRSNRSQCEPCGRDVGPGRDCAPECGPAPP